MDSDFGIVSSEDEVDQLKARVEQLEHRLEEVTRHTRARYEALIALLERKGILSGQDDFEALYCMDPELADDET